MRTEQLPPHSLESEQAVIGGLLVDREAMTQVADLVRAPDFYRVEHRVIFDAALRLDGAGDPVDLMTLLETLRKSDNLAKAGGTEYLGELAANTPSAANIRAYAEIVRDRAIERELIQAGASFQRIVHEPGDVAAKLDRAQQSVLNIGRQDGTGPVLVRERLGEWIAALDERHQNGGTITGLATGLSDFDKMTGGMHDGDLIIIAGRPAMGKSALAMQIAGVVAQEGVTACVFSLEMPTSQLIDRQVASMSRVPMPAIRSGNLQEGDWRKATEATSVISQMPLVIDDTPGLTMTDMRARARRVKQRHGLGLIVVDYLQLMEGSGENRNQQITEISRGLKRMAKELCVPVIALSQLNRGVEQRQNRRPMMSDLRESGAIEQDADLIAFVYRDEVYNPDSPDKGTAELIIGKHRNGATGMVRLVYIGELTRFESLAQERYERMYEMNRAQSARQRDTGLEDL